MNCAKLMCTHYFRGHTEKKGGRESGEGRRDGEGGESGRGGEGIRKRGREGEEGGGRSRDRGRKGSGGKRKEGGREISLTAAKQSHLPDSSHAQWEPAEANFWSHSWHSCRTNTDAGQ